MNVVMWVLAGGAMGWAGFALLGFNERRGMIVSIVIGVMGGFLGGNVLAPMVVSSTAIPGDFSIPALFIAGIGAAAFLVLGNVIENRFGV